MDPLSERLRDIPGERGVLLRADEFGDEGPISKSIVSGETGNTDGSDG